MLRDLARSATRNPEKVQISRMGAPNLEFFGGRYNLSKPYDYSRRALSLSFLKIKTRLRQSYGEAKKEKKMNGKLTPESFLEEAKKKLEEKESVKRKKEAEERKAKKEQRITENEYKKWKVLQAPKALKQSKEIFKWVENLLKDEKFSEFFEKLKSDYYFMNIFATHGFLKSVQESRTRAVYFILDWKSTKYRQQGLSVHFSKSGCGTTDIRPLFSPEETVKQVDPRLVNLFHQHIFSGEVWKTIKSEFENKLNCDLGV